MPAPFSREPASIPREDGNKAHPHGRQEQNLPLAEAFANRISEDDPGTTSAELQLPSWFRSPGFESAFPLVESSFRVQVSLRDSCAPLRGALGFPYARAPVHMPHRTPGGHARLADRTTRRLVALLVVAVASTLAAVFALRPDPHAPGRPPVAGHPPPAPWRPEAGVYHPQDRTVRCAGSDAAGHEAAYRDSLGGLRVRVHAAGAGSLRFQAVRNGEAGSPFEPRAAAAPGGGQVLVLSSATTPDGRTQVRWEADGSGGAREVRTFESHAGDRFACSVRFRLHP